MKINANAMNPGQAGVTKELFFLAMIAGISFLAAGCASDKYKPAVSLGMSPQTIKASVKLEPFIDQSPESDKKVINSATVTLEGELASDVTDAVLADFNNNRVFESVKKQSENQPDLVMKGTIHRFYGKVTPAGVGWLIIPPLQLFWLTGLPISKDYGQVDLEISLDRPDGTVLGRYHGQSEYFKIQQLVPVIREKRAAASPCQDRRGI